MTEITREERGGVKTLPDGRQGHNREKLGRFLWRRNIMIFPVRYIGWSY